MLSSVPHASIVLDHSEFLLSRYLAPLPSRSIFNADIPIGGTRQRGCEGEIHVWGHCNIFKTRQMNWVIMRGCMRMV
jgi:hypothetical protein